MDSLHRQRKKADSRKKTQRIAIRPWLMAGFCCVALALAQATLIGLRWLTLVLLLTGMAVAGYEYWSQRHNRQPHDKLWFLSTVILGGILVIMTCFAPGIINNRWELEGAVEESDPNQLSVVHRDKSLEKGRPLAADEIVDSINDAVRQGDVVIRIEGARVGQVPGKGEKAFLLVQLRIVNVSQLESISLAGFDEHQPVLSGESGRTYQYLEQRYKQIKNRSVVFVPWEGRQSIEIGSRAAQEMMLIFEPPTGIEPLRLELNCTAWGRQGLFQFRLGGVTPSKF